jgi:trehalose 6-phosphate synthase/phosphatase
MRRMRRSIRGQDVFWWVDSFLRAAISRGLQHFPAPADRGSGAAPENQIPV